METDELILCWIRIALMLTGLIMLFISPLIGLGLIGLSIGLAL